MVSESTHTLAEEIPRLLQLIGADAPPVNIGRIAELLGARVYAAELDTATLQGLSMIGPDEVTIFVSEQLTPEWKRFVVAKELAHILLDRAGNTKTKDTDALLSEIAGELLVPKEQLLAAWQHSHDAQRLAQRFFVPSSVIEARLATLDLGAS